MIKYKSMIGNENLKSYGQSQKDKGGTEINKMEIQEQVVNWDEAVEEPKFIELEEDKRKVLVLKDWCNVKCVKFGEEKVEFRSKVVEEDGKECEKEFTTTSNRLKKKLRPVLEGLDPAKEVRLSVTPTGEKFKRQYAVEKL